MASLGFIDGVRREIARMGSRPAYLIGMIIIPLAVTLFFVSLLSEGLAQRLPTAVVDYDHSPMSRQVTRTIEASQLMDVRYHAESYDKAMEKVRSGEVFGFFVIPSNFESDALGGRTPTLEYFSNMTYFVPGTLVTKGFKTVAVTTSGGVVRNTLVSLGVDPERIGGMLQPVVFDINPLANPWMNYSIYLTPSYTMATYALMIMLMTVLSVCGEIKDGTSRQWLATAKGRISVALLSKLLPHTIVYWAVGLFITWVFFGWQHFPMNGSLGWMIAATFLLAVASQAFALFVCSALPNPRMAFSVCSLFGVLSYSFTGFAMPVDNMYGAIAAFSWTAPVRYWFLVFSGNALNGYPMYYWRLYMAGLLVFPMLCWVLARRLKKAMLNPVYIP